MRRLHRPHLRLRRKATAIRSLCRSRSNRSRAWTEVLKAVLGRWPLQFADPARIVSVMSTESSAAQNRPLRASSRPPTRHPRRTDQTTLPDGGRHPLSERPPRRTHPPRLGLNSQSQPAWRNGAGCWCVVTAPGLIAALRIGGSDRSANASVSDCLPDRAPWRAEPDRRPPDINPSRMPQTAGSGRTLRSRQHPLRTALSR